MRKILYFWLILLLVQQFTYFVLEDIYGERVTFWIYFILLIVLSITILVMVFQKPAISDEISDEELAKLINEEYDENK